MKKRLAIVISAALLLCMIPMGFASFAAEQTVCAVNSTFEDQQVAPWIGSGATVVADTVAKNGSYGMKMTGGRFQANIVAGDGEGKIKPGVKNELNFWMRADSGITNTINIVMQVNYTGGAQSISLAMDSPANAFNGENWINVVADFNVYINSSNELYAEWRRPDMTSNTAQALATGLADGAVITSFDIIVLTGAAISYYDDITISSVQDVPITGTVYSIKEDFEDQAADGWTSPFATALEIGSNAKNGSYGLKTTMGAGQSQNRIQINLAADNGAGNIPVGTYSNLDFWVRSDTGVTDGLSMVLYANTTLDGGKDLVLSWPSINLNGDNWVNVTAGFNLYIKNGTELWAKWRRPDMSSDAEQKLFDITTGSQITSYDLVIYSAAPVMYYDDIKLSSTQILPEQEIINAVDFEDGTAGSWHSSGSATHSVVDAASGDNKILSSALITGNPWNRLQANIAAGTAKGTIREGEKVEVTFDIMAPENASGTYNVQAYVNTDTQNGIQVMLGENIALSAGTLEKFKANFTLDIENGVLSAKVKRHGLTDTLSFPSLASQTVNNITSVDIVILSSAEQYYADNIKIGYNLEFTEQGGGSGDGSGGDGSGGNGGNGGSGDSATDKTEWDFEDGGKSGWTGGIDDAFSNITIIDEAALGGKVMKATKADTSNQVRAQIKLSKDVIAIDKTYTVSEKLRLDDGVRGDAKVFLFVSTVEKGDYMIVIDEIALSGDVWSEYECDFTISKEGDNKIVVSFTRSNGIKSTGTIVGDNNLTITGYYLTYYCELISSMYVDDIAIKEKLADSGEKTLEIKNGDFTKGNIWWNGVGYSDLTIVSSGKKGNGLNVVAKEGMAQNRAQYFFSADDIKDGQYYELSGYMKAADGKNAALQTLMIMQTNKAEYSFIFENQRVGSEWAEFNNFFQVNRLEDAIEANYSADGERYDLWGSEIAQGEELLGVYFVVLSLSADEFNLDELKVEEISAPEIDEDDEENDNIGGNEEDEEDESEENLDNTENSEKPSENVEENETSDDAEDSLADDIPVTGDMVNVFVFMVPVLALAALTFTSKKKA